MRRGDEGGLKPPSRRSLLAGLLGATATLSLIAIAALVWIWSSYLGPGPAAAEGEATTVILPSGSSVDAIGAALHEAGVIRSPDMFRAAVTLTGSDRSLRAGEYRIESRASLRAVVRKLTSGQVVRHFVTLPEGRSSAQAVDILNANPILVGEVEVPPEGSLWPETYEVTRGETRASVVARMQRARDEALAELWATRAPGLPIRTPEEAVILASIVEKETGQAGERPKVAAVFVNRMRIGMMLQSDPTTIYGLGERFDGNLRRRDLREDTPYNTYTRGGLPPTPIALPGLASIEAVLNPADIKALYFVARGDGTSQFSDNLADHNRAVARYQLGRK